MRPAEIVKRQNIPLVIDDYGMSIGPFSVGIPVVATTDIVLEKYLELIRLASPERRTGAISVRADDIGLLAETMGIAPDTVGERLQKIQF